MQELFYAFKDSCGCGIIANVFNQPSRAITEDAMTALSRMIHRGAIAADGKSGDGCGLLLSMPDKFMRHVARENNFDLPAKYAVGMLFLTHEKQKEIIQDVCEQQDLKVLFFRNVPIDESVLGKLALATLPIITQVFITPASLMANNRFQAALYLTRKKIEHQLQHEKDFYIASFSDTVISYKGLVMPNKLKELFIDLQQENFESGFVLFHQRFSTNTLPKWALAQPFRTLAHNGEINSIEGNRYTAKVNTENPESHVFTANEMQQILPVLDEYTSDSGSVDCKLPNLSST